MLVVTLVLALCTLCCSAVVTAASNADSAATSVSRIEDSDYALGRFASCRCDDGDYVRYIGSNITNETAYERFSTFILDANSTMDDLSKDEQEYECAMYRRCDRCPAGHYCPSGGLCHKPINCAMRASGFLTFCFEPGLVRPQHSLWGTIIVLLSLVCGCGGSAVLCKLSDRKRLKRSRVQLESRLLEDKLLKRFGETVIQQVHSEIGGRGEAVEIVTHEFKGLQRRPVDRQIGIEFENLGLVLPSGKCVLRGVSGEFQRGMLTAVMGPSGSGKTTFLNVLCGRATYGDMFGSIKINGKAGRVDQLRTLFGFVPQDDIVFSDLTVRENLRFSASLRLPPHRWAAENSKGEPPSCGTFWKKVRFVEQAQRRRDIVLDVLHVLGIDHIADEIVGDVEKRGISGGQRKRVNIGLEMVADPAVLFLDEPTSGLDSTASTLVLAALKEVAQLGVTVATVIHQPRYSIFTLFDQTLLLAKGGLAVYLGWSSDALVYFESLSFVCPDRVNPADFFLDVISGEVPCPTVEMFEATRDLPRIWASLQVKVRESKKAAKYEFLAQKARLASQGLLMSASPRTAAKNTAVSKRGSQTAAFTDSVGRVFDHFNVSGTGILNFDECKALVSPSLHAAGIECSDINISMTIAAVVASGQKDGSEKAVLTRNRFIERMTIFRERARAMRHEEGTAHSNDDSEEMRLLTEDSAVMKNRGRNGLFLTVKHTFERSILQLGRHVADIISDAILSVAPAFIVGLVFTAKWKEFKDAPNIVFLSMLVLALVQLIGTIRTLSSERLLFYRERERGLFVPAYFITKDMMCLLDIAVRASLYSGLVYSFLVPQCGIITVWLMSFMVCYYASGIGFLLAAVLSPNSALIAGVILPTTVGSLLSGMIETVPNWMTYLSFIRYATEWFIVKELEAIDKATGFDPSSDDELSLTTLILSQNTKGYARGDIPALALFLYGFAFRIITVIALHLVNNDRVSYLIRRVMCAACRRKNLAATKSSSVSDCAAAVVDDQESSAIEMVVDRTPASSGFSSDDWWSPRGITVGSVWRHSTRGVGTVVAISPDGKCTVHVEFTNAASKGVQQYNADSWSKFHRFQHQRRRRTRVATMCQDALLNSAALQRFTSAQAATTTKTMRFRLPHGCFSGQLIHVENPVTSKEMAVTVPFGAIPGNFVTMRYNTSMTASEEAPVLQLLIQAAANAHHQTIRSGQSARAHREGGRQAEAMYARIDGSVGSNPMFDVEKSARIDAESNATADAHHAGTSRFV